MYLVLRHSGVLCAMLTGNKKLCRDPVSWVGAERHSSVTLLVWGLGEAAGLCYHISIVAKLQKAKSQRNRIHSDYTGTISCSGEDQAQNLLQGVWLLGILNSIVIFVYQKSAIAMSVTCKGFGDSKLPADSHMLALWLAEAMTFIRKRCRIRWEENQS